jgi:hypothetical protein
MLRAPETLMEEATMTRTTGGWLAAGTALVLLAVAGCGVSTVSNEMVLRCCYCLVAQDCLEGIDEMTCREDIAESGDSDFDVDCQVEGCGAECDFLYW